MRDERPIPPSTTIAIAYLLSAPAPLPTTKGIAPSIVEKVVIKTGLNRIKEDS